MEVSTPNLGAPAAVLLAALAGTLHGDERLSDPVAALLADTTLDLVDLEPERADRPGGAVLSCPGDGGEAAAEWRPDPEEKPGIADNSFLIEEAYNQEPGVIQHIFTGQWRLLEEPGQREQEYEMTFTQEWPVPGVAHQLSYTIPLQWLRGDRPHHEDVGDVLLNYRYQLLEESTSRPAFAPRLSLVLPTGDADKGIGKGGMGYQLNLPLSKKVGDHFHFHLNAGATLTPDAEADLSGSRATADLLVDYHFGFSAIAIVRNDFNLLVELLASRVKDLAGEGKEESGEMLVSPGFRYAFNFRGGAQIVLGAAAPLGLTDETEDFRAFLYLSLEHALWTPSR